MNQEKNKTAKSNALRRTMPWIALGFGLSVLACLIFFVVSVFVQPLEKSPSNFNELEDVDFIGQDCFYSIQLAALINSPHVHDKIKVLPVDDRKRLENSVVEIEKKLGMKLTEIERLTCVFLPNRINPAVFIRTNVEIDQDNISAAFSVEKPQRKGHYTPYYLLDALDRPGAIVFVSKHLALFADHGDVWPYLVERRMRKPPPNLKHSIEILVKRNRDLFLDKNNHFVGQFPTDSHHFEKVIPPDIRIPNLDDRMKLRIHGLTVTGRVKDQIEIEMRFQASNPEMAILAKSDLETLKQNAMPNIKLFPNEDEVRDQKICGWLQSIHLHAEGAGIVAIGKIEFELAQLLTILNAVDLRTHGEHER